MPSKKELYKRVKDIIPSKEFSDRIRTRVKEWNGLIDEEAAAFLVVDELGRNEIAFQDISGLDDGTANIRGIAESVGEVREVNTRRGPTKVADIVLSDGTGRCRLTLWGEDTGLIEELGIRAGARLRIVNGYVKRSRFGVEVSRGRWGLIETEYEALGKQG